MFRRIEQQIPFVHFDTHKNALDQTSLRTSLHGTFIEMPSGTLLTDVPFRIESIGRTYHAVIVRGVDQRNTVSFQYSEYGRGYSAPKQMYMGDVGTFVDDQFLQPALRLRIVEIVDHPFESGYGFAVRDEIFRLFAGEVPFVAVAEKYDLVSGFTQYIGRIEIDRLATAFPVVEIVYQQYLH